MNYFEYMCEMTRYKPITSMWVCFSIIEDAMLTDDPKDLRNLYDKCFEKCRDDYKVFTELVMVVNWKSWYWNDLGKSKLSQFYADLYYEAYDYGLEHFKGDELTYFWRTLD